MDTKMAEFKHLVRIANTDLKGQKAIVYALKDIRGVGVPLANAICTVANVDGLQKTGNLPDSDIKKIDEIVKSLDEYGIPGWMMNRRKDMETGKDRHIITNDLIFYKENDVKMMKYTKSYKGMRHAHGQPVRGQRTRSKFRANKGKVMGVKTSGKKKGAS